MAILEDRKILPVEMYAIGLGLELAADEIEKYPEAAGTVARLRAWARDYLLASSMNITAHVLLDRPSLPKFMTEERVNGPEPQ